VHQKQPPPKTAVSIALLLAKTGVDVFINQGYCRIMQLICRWKMYNLHAITYLLLSLTIVAVTLRQYLKPTDRRSCQHPVVQYNQHVLMLASWAFAALTVLSFFLFATKT
jgi:hypothetical protein